VRVRHMDIYKVLHFPTFPQINNSPAHCTCNYLVLHVICCVAPILWPFSCLI